MRLLDGKSLQLVSFANEEQTPPYAILSHTWLDNDDDEVSFRDMMSNAGAALAAKTGWSKIENVCRIALSLGLEYVWIDTCCIDKSSSAELQEAINSMFRWYELAGICFAYLSDFSWSEDPETIVSSFRHSRWFKRGWTLQELIAPTEVFFYDKHWKRIASREEIADTIEDITGIRNLFLSDGHRHESIGETLSTASVAERMSWMGERETRRPEDLAYCLLGIFDINMPMLYGEGHKAFQRLQEEIMKKSDDNSLLCWGYQDPNSYWRGQKDSLLAPKPSSFKGCKELEPCHIQGFHAASFAMNQRGLQMEVLIRLDSMHERLVYIILGCSTRFEVESSPGETKCHSEDSSPRFFVAIPLISTTACSVFKRGQTTQKGEYLRPRWCRPILVSKEFLEKAHSTKIVIRRSSEQIHKFQELPFSISLPPVPISQRYTILGTYPPQPIGSRLALLCTRDNCAHRQYTMIQLRIQELGIFVVVLGYRGVGWRVLQGLTTRDCFDINCRVFKAPENCGLEALCNLSLTEGFFRLPKIDFIFRDDRYIFKIGIEADAYLMIQLVEDEEMTETTSIFISVTHPSDVCPRREDKDVQERTATGLLRARLD